MLESPPEELNLETQWLSKMQRSFSIMIVQLDSSAPSEGGLLSRAELTNLVGNLERLRDTLDNTGKASKLASGGFQLIIITFFFKFASKRSKRCMLV